MESVLMKGPYTYRGMPMILKEWRKEFNLKKDLMRTIPIWVKFPMLPLHLWGKSNLSKLASAIGIPLVTDECTASKLRVSYARVLIEVDITQKLVEEISIKDKESNTVIQRIEYEWRPKFCPSKETAGTTTLKTLGIVKTTDTVTTPKRISTDRRHQSLVYGSTEEGIWKQGKSRNLLKDHAKDAMDIHCENGYGVLGGLNEPLVIDRGPF
ncbi:unnamed protein product [Vicia faba]|nr:unnamed protein product [Vicia faba]